MNAPYIPDVGDTFTVVKTWEYRRWQWLPFPWRYKRVIPDEQHYRVSGWLRRRTPPPPPADEHEALVRQMIAEMLADGRIESPRGTGPDNVPLEFCHREEAEYVCGTGVAGTIQRVSDVTVTGRVNWPEETFEEERRHADMFAGEPLV